MTAGIICAYVSREIAGAFFSVTWIWRHVEVLAYGSFKCLHRHTAGAVCTEGFQGFAFSTGLYDNAVFLSDFHKS